MKDGRLVAAAQEERFSRIKHDPSIPKQPFRYCLEAAGLTIGDVDCVAFYENPTKKLARQLWSGQIEAAAGDPFRFSATRPAHQIRDVPRLPRADSVRRSSQVARGEQLLLLGLPGSRDHDGGQRRRVGDDDLRGTGAGCTTRLVKHRPTVTATMPQR